MSNLDVLREMSRGKLDALFPTVMEIDLGVSLKGRMTFHTSLSASGTVGWRAETTSNKLSHTPRLPRLLKFWNHAANIHGK